MPEYWVIVDGRGDIITVIEGYIGEFTYEQITYEICDWLLNIEPLESDLVDNLDF
jgi:hypothetical protein